MSAHSYWRTDVLQDLGVLTYLNVAFLQGKRHDLKASQQQNSNPDRSSPRQLNHAAKIGRSDALQPATLDARKGTSGRGASPSHTGDEKDA